MEVIQIKVKIRRQKAGIEESQVNPFLAANAVVVRSWVFIQLFCIIITYNHHTFLCVSNITIFQKVPVTQSCT